MPIIPKHGFLPAASLLENLLSSLPDLGGVACYSYSLFKGCFPTQTSLHQPQNVPVVSRGMCRGVWTGPSRKEKEGKLACDSIGSAAAGHPELFIHEHQVTPLEKDLDVGVLLTRVCIGRRRL